MRQKILIINDSSLEGRIMLDLLSCQGYHVNVARNGHEGLSMARSFDPDLIICDLVLPGLSGLELVNQLKEDLSTKKIEIIFASGSNNKEDKIEAFKLGAFDYLLKPLDYDEMLMRLELALRYKRSIDKLKRRETIIRADSLRDFLTGLYNRQYLDQKMTEELARVKRYGNTFSILLLDIDFFKQINDTHGHLIGDKILIHVAGRLQLKVRSIDTVCRFGGEEFCVIAPETDITGASHLAEKLRKILGQEPVAISKELMIPVTASFGIAEYKGVDDTIQSLLERADRALYNAKKKGRNRVEIN
ncbi:diguanylate cyclase [Heliorestis acidaminivorans]|uniref:Stage 0 sporulation protein A homolog n=1 Tax=Heliorestis acidaminivorans TaxID=553427 RepID=A0A6I0F290_9FIRM|nr:diguanylate cyclase [Heliorestis acidaminivorans]KAB2951169.1 diguanylate cyclase [Heliorestis acidaminivorans]